MVPTAMAGHSIGEYTAACQAGVFSLEDALTLIAARGKLMQQLPQGAMLAVSLPAEEARTRFTEALALAADNSPSQSVFSGTPEAVTRTAAQLEQQGITCRLLQTSHAFHSEMMEPILEPFREQLVRISLKNPKIPYSSNLTGTWIRNEQATDPAYWCRHLRETVRFRDNLAQLLEDENRILLEVGPGRALTQSALKHPHRSPKHIIIPGHPMREDAHGTHRAYLSQSGKTLASRCRDFLDRILSS